jgi:hypothetical protein
MREQRRLSTWARLWLVIAVLVAAFCTFVAWAIYDFGEAYNGVAAVWDRPTSLSTMIGLAIIGTICGAAVFGAAMGARSLWRMVRPN